MGLYESMCVFVGIAMVRENILSIINVPSKIKLSSISNTFEMVIHTDLHQMHYKCNNL